MQIVDNRALLFVTRKADQITALIPKSKVLESNGDVDQVLVHWDFDEVQLLRNLGIKNVPSPILSRYKWPGMYTPFEHQRTTAEFLTLNPRCFVFNEAGTGKTVLSRAIHGWGRRPEGRFIAIDCAANSPCALTMPDSISVAILEFVRASAQD